MKPDNETGQFRCKVVVNPDTNLEATHTVLWRIRSLYEVVPERLVVKPDFKNEFQETVIVHRRDGHDFRLSSHDHLPAGVTCSIGEANDGEGKLLHFTINRQMLKRPQLTKLQFQSSAEDDSLVSIPLVVLPSVSREHSRKDNQPVP